jgi:hypothetical protein
MKNRLLLLSTAFALALSIGVTSCKKDKDDSPKPLTATVNGSGFDPLYVTANASQGDIHIEGTAKDSSYLIVTFPVYTYFSGSAHGTVTVSTFDKTNKKVAGTFTGVLYNWSGAKDSLTVTNGQFNTTYK